MTCRKLWMTQTALPITSGDDMKTDTTNFEKWRGDVQSISTAILAARPSIGDQGVEDACDALNRIVQSAPTQGSLPTNDSRYSISKEEMIEWLMNAALGKGDSQRPVVYAIKYCIENQDWKVRHVR